MSNSGISSSLDPKFVPKSSLAVISLLTRTPRIYRSVRMKSLNSLIDIRLLPSLSISLNSSFVLLSIYFMEGFPFPSIAFRLAIELIISAVISSKVSSPDLSKSYKLKISYAF
jgi:hypothetical protein